jgi:hypothetical protein
MAKDFGAVGGLAGAGSGTRPGAQVVASFAEGRIGYREWARRNGHPGDIHSIDDCLNHDIDELFA